MACRRPSLRFRPPAQRWVRPPAPRRGFPFASCRPRRIFPPAPRRGRWMACRQPSLRFRPPARLWARPPAPCRGLHQLLYRSFPIPSAYALSPVRLPPAADRAATSLKILPVPRAPSGAGCAAAFQNPVSANARAVSPRARPRGRFLIHPRRAGFFRLRRVGMAAGFACVPPTRGFPRIASIMVHGSGLLRCAGARPYQIVRRRFGIFPSAPPRCTRAPAPKRLAPAPPSGLAPPRSHSTACAAACKMLLFY